MFKELISKIDLLKPVFILDYSFLESIIQDNFNLNSDNRTSAVDLLETIKSVNIIDYFGNNIDFRFVHYGTKIINENTFNLYQNILEKNEFSICMLNKVRIPVLIQCYSYKIDSNNLKEYWSFLSKGYTISIVEGEKAENIEEYWKMKFKEIPPVNHKWLIIQEPFLFDKYGNHLNNVIEIIKNIKAQKYLIICRKSNISNERLIEFKKVLDELKIEYELVEYVEEKKGKKKVHKRFILTNNLLINTGDSFGFYNIKENKVVTNEELKVSSFINDFDSIKNRINSIKQLLN